MAGTVLAVAAAVAGTVWLLWDRVFADMLLVGMIRNFIEMLLMLKDVKGHEKVVKKNKKWNFVDFFEGTVDADPDNVLFIVAEDGSEHTRGAVDEEANGLAAWAHSLGLKQRDSVALMMPNRPAFFAFWLGMAKVGVSTGLLNTNLMGKSLLHSVELAVRGSSQKVLVVDAELMDGLAAELPQLKALGIQVFSWDDVAHGVMTIRAGAAGGSSGGGSGRPGKEGRSEITPSDTLILIYTSGTTGLPKASKISHTRYLNGGSMMKVFCYLKPGDRQYCCLPLVNIALHCIELH
jgi:fatty-acyl-CoA synthase